MKKYMIAYYGGNQPSSKEEAMAQMSMWKKWIESLGDSVVNAGTPLLNTKVISKNDVTDNDRETIKGFAIIQSDNFESAVKMTQSDPFLANGGIIRLSEMMEMP